MAGTINHRNSVSENKELAGAMERNIKQLIKMRQEEEKAKSGDEHLAEKITGFTGTMFFVYLHLALIGAYILWNSGVTAIKPIDPTFSGLSTIASVEAIFLSTFVLIRQNRMNKLADKRANLDLQVSLLAEHEISRLITLVTAMGRKEGLSEADDPEFKELAKEVRPEEVLSTIDKQKEESVAETGIDY